MQTPRRRLDRHVLLLAAAIALALAAAAVGADGFPRIHTPRGYGGELAHVDVEIANTDRRTRVTICVSGRCRRARRIGQRRWSAYAGRVRAGQTRTVRITAANATRGEQWGDAPLRFR